MKTLFRPSESRLHKQDAWKKSAYAFVPYQTNFGALCGFADDVVQAGKGFGMHPHENMEISTIVLQGAQAHRDNTGSEGIIDSQTVQTMSAGTGIMHSEYNNSPTEAFWSYQIWVYPKEMNVLPRHEKFTFQPEDKYNKFLLALSPDRRQGSALINQNAFFSLCTLEAGKEINYTMYLPTHGVYVHCAVGEVKIGNFVLKAGDAIGVYETVSFDIVASSTAELILVEVPMERGIKI